MPPFVWYAGVSLVLGNRTWCGRDGAMRTYWYKALRSYCYDYYYYYYYYCCCCCHCYCCCFRNSVFVQQTMKTASSDEDRGRGWANARIEIPSVTGLRHHGAIEPQAHTITTCHVCRSHLKCFRSEGRHPELGRGLGLPPKGERYRGLHAQGDRVERPDEGYCLSPFPVIQW